MNSELTHEHSAYWEDVESIPPLLFDHGDMVRQARSKLITLVHHAPVGFKLLPELFTLTQLQQLYEAIIGESVDKRNFRKRVGEMPYVEKTESVDKMTSRRGAALYRFNEQVYQQEKKFKL